MSYTFPYDTCEYVVTIFDGVKTQPISTFLNSVNCVFIYRKLRLCSRISTKSVIASVLLFELFHMLSHLVHIDGGLQTNLVHFSAYCVNVSLLCRFNELKTETAIIPSTVFDTEIGFLQKYYNHFFLTYLFCLVCFDIYGFFFLSVIEYLTTQVIIFASLLIFYYKYIPSSVKHNTIAIVSLSGLIVSLFLIEEKYCVQMIAKQKIIPFHAIIEILGILLFDLFTLCLVEFDKDFKKNT